MDARQVLANLSITAKALVLGKPRLEFGEDARRQRRPFARGFFDGQQCIKPSRLVECKPGLDGMPMDGQQFR